MKSTTKNANELILKLSLNIIGNSNGKTNFLHELLLTNRQVANICKAFVNNSSASMKLSKMQLHKIIQTGGFLGKLLEPLLNTVFSLISNVLQPLSKNIRINNNISSRDRNS